MSCFDGVTYFFFPTHWGTTLNCSLLPSVGDGAFCAPADQSLRRGAASSHAGDFGKKTIRASARPEIYRIYNVGPPSSKLVYKPH